MNQAVSQRIAVLRIIMIVGVVILHTPLYEPIAETRHDVFSLLKAFFQHAFFRASVPMLTVISGFLLFQSAADLSPRKLWASKLRALGIPFAVFNIGLLGLVVGINQSTGMMAGEIPASFMDAAFGATGAPINYPLNFLRDLMVLALLAPLMGLLLRNFAWGGLALVALVFMGNIDGHLLLRGEMAVFFYFGGMVAVRKWNVLALDKYAPAALVTLLVLCALVVAFKTENRTPLKLAAPILLWSSAAMLSGPRGAWLARQSKYSFFIFLAHAPVLAATWVAYKAALPSMPYPIYWLCAPIVTIGALVVVHMAASALIPRTFALITGGKPKPVARMPIATTESA